MAAALLTAVIASVAGIGMAVYLGLTAASSTMLSRHILVGIFSTMICLLSHSMMMFYFLGKGKAVKEAAAEGGLSDAEMMLRVKAGDDSAFDYLVQKYRRPIISFMYRMAHNSAAAEDLAQEVFLRVYRSRASYEPSAKFSTWLYRIATNLGVNHARDTRHERPENITNLDEADEETGQTPDLADKAPTIEEEIVRRERLTAIRQKVEALPDRQKMAVLMHKYQQMDYKQIAEVLRLHMGLGMRAEMGTHLLCLVVFEGTGVGLLIGDTSFRQNIENGFAFTF